MTMFELVVEQTTTYTIQVEADDEENASHQALEMPSKELDKWATDENIEIIDVFELKQ